MGARKRRTDKKEKNYILTSFIISIILLRIFVLFIVKIPLESMRLH